MPQNSLLFDISDLPDQEAPKPVSVVFDTSNLPDVEQDSNSTLTPAGTIPVEDASEGNHD